MDSKVIQKINNLLVEEFEVDAELITPEAGLKETLDLDSLDYIDLIAITESNFGCKIKPEDFNRIRTFGEFYNYIIAYTCSEPAEPTKQTSRELAEPKELI